MLAKFFQLVLLYLLRAGSILVWLRNSWETILRNGAGSPGLGKAGKSGGAHTCYAVRKIKRRLPEFVYPKTGKQHSRRMVVVCSTTTTTTNTTTTTTSCCIKILHNKKSNSSSSSSSSGNRNIRRNSNITSSSSNSSNNKQRGRVQSANQLKLICII